MKLRCAPVVAFSIPLVLAASVHAGIIFDPDGAAPANPAYNVQSFDFLPGNSLAKNALTSPGSFVQLYQARLGALIAPDGSVIPVVGLNSTFEITVVAGYTASSTTSAGVTNSTLAAGASYVKLFYDPSMDANDLAGTGFSNGSPIYSALVSSATGVFLNQGPGFSSYLLDQFGADDWAGQQTVRAIGGLSLTGSTTAINASFFLSGFEVFSMAANTSTALAYLQANPSKQFLDLSGSPVAPNIGALNGVSGPDIMIQADANAAFQAVPEPASLGLLGLGALTLLASRRR